MKNIIRSEKLSNKTIEMNNHLRFLHRNIPYQYNTTLIYSINVGARLVSSISIATIPSFLKK